MDYLIGIVLGAVGGVIVVFLTIPTMDVAQIIVLGCAGLGAAIAAGKRKKRAKPGDDEG